MDHKKSSSSSIFIYSHHEVQIYLVIWCNVLYLRGSDCGLEQANGIFSLQPGKTFLLPDLLLFLSGPFEGRATIAGATVTLQKVTQEDAGQYRCEISAPLDSVTLGETNVTLKVLGIPKKNCSNVCEIVFFSSSLCLCFCISFIVLTSSAPTHPVLRNPQWRSDGLGGAAALQGPAEHTACHVFLVQGQPADKPAAPRQRHLSNQPTHRHTG